MNDEGKESLQKVAMQPKKFVGINGKDLCYIIKISTDVVKNDDGTYTTRCYVKFGYVEYKQGVSPSTKLRYIHPNFVEDSRQANATNINGDVFDYNRGKAIALSKCMAKVYEKIDRVQAKNMKILDEELDMCSGKSLLSEHLIGKEERFIANT